MQDGKTVANVRVALSESYKDKAGEWKEVTEWVTLVAFGYEAEKIERRVKKGRILYFEGKLKTEKYTGKDGAEKYATKVVVSKVVPLQALQRDQDDRQRPAQSPGQPMKRPDDVQDPFDDEIPF
jgi:single-strand DNA-binding protein